MQRSDELPLADLRPRLARDQNNLYASHHEDGIEKHDVLKQVRLPRLAVRRGWEVLEHSTERQRWQG